MLSVFSKNGKKYVNISRKSWKSYLDIKSPHRYYDYNTLECSKNVWCATCNSGLGSWSETCVNKITNFNLQKYQNILSKRDEKDEKDYHFYEIEIHENEPKWY